MNRKREVIKTKAGYNYIYIPQSQSFHLLTDECVPYWTGDKTFDGTYASKKVEYLKNMERIFEGEEKFITKYSPEILH